MRYIFDSKELGNVSKIYVDNTEISFGLLGYFKYLTKLNTNAKISYL